MAIYPTDANNLKIQTGQQMPPAFETESSHRQANGGEKTNQNGNGKLSAQETREMVASLTGYMEILQTSLSFNVMEDKGRVVVTITNKETDEVIRQIPSEELIALQEKMKELTGIIFNEIA
ncbi:MAG: flagellar protein FlaG [Thermodesulfobacteriota bacterium]